MSTKRKVLKVLKKRCPDCDKFGIELVLYSETVDGATHETEYEECDEDCGYSKETNRRKHKDAKLNLKLEY